MQLVVQYLTQAAIKLPNAGNNTSAVRRLPSAARTVRDTGVRYSVFGPFLWLHPVAWNSLPDYLRDPSRFFAGS